MRQSNKLEKYKNAPSPENAIHIRYDFTTGDVIRQEDEASNRSYSEAQQLQLDAIAIYLIFICEMIASGLEIIFSMHEVAFIQNLVYYIERAYRYIYPFFVYVFCITAFFAWILRSIMQKKEGVYIVIIHSSLSYFVPVILRFSSYFVIFDKIT